MGQGYAAKRRPDGTWDILKVPVFAEHSLLARRGDGSAKKLRVGADWLEKAVRVNQARYQLDGYLPPLHVGHKGAGRPPTSPAGHFRLRGVRQGWYEGRPNAMIVADLVRVPDAVYQRIRAGQYPYLSAEVHDLRRPELDSMALLADEVPFFRLPLLRVGQEGQYSASQAACVGSLVRWGPLRYGTKGPRRPPNPAGIQGEPSFIGRLLGRQSEESTEKTGYVPVGDMAAHGFLSGKYEEAEMPRDEEEELIDEREDEGADYADDESAPKGPPPVETLLQQAMAASQALTQSLSALAQGLAGLKSATYADEEPIPEDVKPVDLPEDEEEEEDYADAPFKALAPENLSPERAIKGIAGLTSAAPQAADAAMEAATGKGIAPSLETEEEAPSIFADEDDPDALAEMVKSGVEKGVGKNLKPALSKGLSETLGVPGLSREMRQMQRAKSGYSKEGSMRKMLAQYMARQDQLERQLAGERARRKVEVNIRRTAATLAGRGYYSSASEAESKLGAVYSAHGLPGLKAYVAAVQEREPDPPEDLADLGVPLAKANDADVASYAASGPEALSQARQYAAEYDALGGQKTLRVTRAEYLASSIHGLNGTGKKERT